jgi:hypothetical protein
MYVKIPETLQPVPEERWDRFEQELIEAMSKPLPRDDGHAYPFMPCFTLEVRK